MFAVNGEGDSLASIVSKGGKSEGILTFDRKDRSSAENSVEAVNGMTFQPIPLSITGERERDVTYLSGQSGSGKSYFSAELIRQYRKAKRSVFVITDIPDKKFEPCTYLDIDDLVGIGTSYLEKFAEYKHKMAVFREVKKELSPEERIEMQKNIVAPPIAGKNKLELKFTEDEMATLFHDSVILFDDYENNADIKLISFLRDHFLTKGRHWNASVIICNHSTNFGRGAKLIMGETTNFVLFSASRKRERHYFYTEYMKWKKSEITPIERMLQTSRWIYIDAKNDVVLSQRKGIFLDG